jgi:hypothetical protein
MRLQLMRCTNLRNSEHGDVKFLVSLILHPESHTGHSLWHTLQNEALPQALKIVLEV